jgi:hypothetical protein
MAVIIGRLDQKIHRLFWVLGAHREKKPPPVIRKNTFAQASGHLCINLQMFNPPR